MGSDHWRLGLSSFAEGRRKDAAGGGNHRMITRRSIVLGAGAFAAAGLMGTGSLRAQQYPTKLLKIVIANPPGGDDDTLSRAIADQMTGEFGQPIIIENRGGASTTI